MKTKPHRALVLMQHGKELARLPVDAGTEIAEAHRDLACRTVKELIQAGKAEAGYFGLSLMAGNENELDYEELIA